MLPLQTASSAELPASLRRDLRALLDAAFPGDFSDDDWAHTLGGTHVWLAGPEGLLSHASLVERVLLCSGERLRVGFVEGVATAAPHRRQGHGARVMTRIGELIRQRHPLGVLSTDAFTFYAPLGWERWRGPTYVDSGDGWRRTPEDDGDIMILRTSRTPCLDLDGDIVCDWRAGDVW